MNTEGHRHTFSVLHFALGPYGPQSVHIHPCLTEGCDRVLIGAGRRTCTKTAQHHRATLGTPTVARAAERLADNVDGV